MLDIYRQHTGDWGNKERLGGRGRSQSCFESDKRGIAAVRDLADSRKIECPSRSVLTIQVYIYRRRKEKFSKLVISSSLFVGLAFLLILLQTFETGLAGIDSIFSLISSARPENGYYPQSGVTLVDHPHDALRPSGRNRCSSLSHELAPVGLLNQLEGNLQNLAAVPSTSDSGTLRFQQDVRLRAQFARRFPTLAMMVLP